MIQVQFAIMSDPTLIGNDLQCFTKSFLLTYISVGAWSRIVLAFKIDVHEKGFGKLHFGVQPGGI